MNLAIIEEAKKLPPAAAEMLCGKNGVEFHPIVCDAVNGRCKHVSSEQRTFREAAYATAAGKSVAVVAEEGLTAAAEAPVADVVADDDEVLEHIAAPPKKKKTSGHK